MRVESGEWRVESPMNTLHSPLSTLHSPLSRLGSPESTTTITFRVDADGVVTGITARDNGVDRELRKVK